MLDPLADHTMEEWRGTGVYAIVHLGSGKKDVGSAAKCFARRWRKHLQDLKNGTHHSRLLQRAFDKYGGIDQEGLRMVRQN